MVGIGMRRRMLGPMPRCVMGCMVGCVVSCEVGWMVGSKLSGVGGRVGRGVHCMWWRMLRGVVGCMLRHEVRRVHGRVLRDVVGCCVSRGMGRGVGGSVVGGVLSVHPPEQKRRLARRVGQRPPTGAVLSVNTGITSETRGQRGWRRIAGRQLGSSGRLPSLPTKTNRHSTLTSRILKATHLFPINRDRLRLLTKILPELKSN